MDSNGLAAPAQVVKKKSSPSTQCQMKTTVPENEAGFLFWDEGSKWVSTSFLHHNASPACDIKIWVKIFSVWSLYFILCVKAWLEVPHWIHTYKCLHTIINVHVSNCDSKHKQFPLHSVYWLVLIWGHLVDSHGRQSQTIQHRLQVWNGVSASDPRHLGLVHFSLWQCTMLLYQCKMGN